MGKASPIKSSSVELTRWLFIIAMFLIFFAPSLYDGQSQAETVVEKLMPSQQVAVSKSYPARQSAQMQPKPKLTLDKMPDIPTGLKISQSFPEERPVSSPEFSSLSIHVKRAEYLLHPIILQASNRYEVDSALVKAIILVESNYNPKAISKRGAKGLMQLMPKTAEALGVGDSFNPEHNINAGVRYFKKLMNQFNGDVKLALAAYNAGSRKVRKYQGVPPFKSTQCFIKKVFEYHRYYKQKTEW